MAEDWTFRAGQTTRVVAIKAGKLESRLFMAGTRVKATANGPEFRLCVGEAPRAISSEAYTAASATNGVFKCRGGSGDPDIEVAFSPDPKAGVVRKTIAVINTTSNRLLLRWAETESLSLGEPVVYAVKPDFPALGDWGQPVFTRHFFIGIEFPAARATALPDGSLLMREYPGIWLKPGEIWRSHPSVLGCAPSGDVSAAFLNYVAGLSPHAPNAPRPFIYWNGFRVILPPNRTEQGLKMVERARELKQQTGFTFDAWTYDAGFDMYRADALWYPNEPDIWSKTRDALKPIGTPTGFWTSFSCIFDTPSHAWGKTQGFGLQHLAAYCLGEPVYAHAMEERLSQIVHDYGMRSINFDGMYMGQGFGCNTPGHGHLVGTGDEAGVYGTYAVVQNKMRIFQRLRRESPGICLDLFICNEWASPWWLTVLDGVHTVAGDTIAAGIPSPWLRDELITVRDMQVWELHKHLNRQFPLWAEDLYGNQVRADHLIDGIELKGEEMGARWEDEYVMALAARGAIEAHIVCCDLNVLANTRSGLNFLGDVGNWIKANADIYRHFALIGGEPARQEAFGYAHGDGKGRAIVGLRNPSIKAQTYPLKITRAFNLGEPGPYQVTMLYPYRYTWPEVRASQSVPIPLADFQVAVLEIRSASRKIAGLPDGRWRDVNGKLETAGVDVPLAKPQINLAIPNPSKPDIMGRVVVPHGQTAELQVRVDPPAGTKKVSARITIDGGEVPVKVHFRDRGTAQDAWLLATIEAGDHQIRAHIDCGSPTRIEAWLQCSVEHTFNPSSAVAPAGLLPSLDPAEQRTIWPALAASYVVADISPMPSGVVWLGDLRDRCVRSETA